MVNGKYVDRSTITVPSIVTSIDDECFRGCFNLMNLELPSSLTELPEDRFLFMEFENLKELKISSNFEF